MSLSDTVPFASSPDSVRDGGGREDEEEDKHFLRVVRARRGLFPYNLVTEMHAILDGQHGCLEEQSAGWGGEGDLQNGSGADMGGEVQARTGKSEKDSAEASAEHKRFLARRNREGGGADGGVEGKEKRRMGVRRGEHGNGGGGGGVGGGGDELTRATHLIDTLLQ